RVKLVVEKIADADNLEAAKETVTTLFDDISERSEHIPVDIVAYIFELEDESEQIDIIASTLPLSTQERQSVLDELLIDVRYEKVIPLLERELNALDVRDEVNSQVNDEINRVQREMFLREQMRVIQMELGEGNVFDQDLGLLQERIIAADLPEEAQQQ